MSRPVRVRSFMFVDQGAAEEMLKLPSGTLRGWCDQNFDLPYFLERGKKTFKIDDLARLVVEVEVSAEKLKGKCIDLIRAEALNEQLTSIPA